MRFKISNIKNHLLSLSLVILFSTCTSDNNEINPAPPSSVDAKIESNVHKEAGFLYRFIVSDNKATLDKEFDFDKNIYPELSNKKLAQKLADKFIDFVPAKFRTSISHFYLIGQGENGSSYGGMVFNTVSNSLDKQGFAISLLTYLNESAGIEREKFFGETVIHELAHVITTNGSQGKAIKDGDPIPDGYQQVSDGIYLKDNSYYKKFLQKFWVDTGVLDKWNTALDKNKLGEFYNAHKDHFVTGYAASNVAEDLAESIRFFIQNDKPVTNEIKAQKINFFYDFPEMVALRNAIRPKINWN